MSKQQIPPAIDEMLWAAAESDAPGLKSDFERRYPEFRAELATRIAMVDVLKKSRPVGSVAPFRIPIESPRTNPWRRMIWVPAAATVLAALAFAAFKITEATAPVATNNIPTVNAPEPNSISNDATGAGTEDVVSPQPSPATIADTGRLPDTETQKQIQLPA